MHSNAAMSSVIKWS